MDTHCLIFRQNNTIVQYADSCSFQLIKSVFNLFNSALPIFAARKLAMRNKVTVLLTILITGFLCKASAQDNNQVLDPVTISSSLTETKSSQSGRNLVIITGDKFNALPVHSIDELL